MASGDIIDPIAAVRFYLRQKTTITNYVPAELIRGRVPKNYGMRTPLITIRGIGGSSENYTQIASPRLAIRCYNGTGGLASIVFWNVVNELQEILSTSFVGDDGNEYRLLSCPFLTGPTDVFDTDLDTPYVEGFWQLFAQRKAV